MNQKMHRFATHDEMLAELEFAEDLGIKIVQQGQTWFLTEVSQ